MMDDTESLITKDEHFEVIDEYVAEENIEDPEKTQTTEVVAIGMQNNHTEQIAHSMSQHLPETDTSTTLEDSGSHENNNIQNDQEITSTDASSNTYSSIKEPRDDVEKKETEKRSECPQALNENSIDFTADIALDHLPNENEITDEDVMHHLDDIENIDLDPSTFGAQDGQSSQYSAVRVTKENSVDSNKEIDVEENKNVEQSLDHTNAMSEQENKIENIWYEKKLAEKVTTVKERLSKLARVLEFSYPTYKKWLELREKIGGTPMCKLEPTCYCPLDKPYTNRWKFICSRKNVQETAEDAGSADAAVNKNVETVWRLEPTGAWGVNINNDSEFPPFVLRAVKTFEDFLQSTEPTTNTESFSDDVSIDMEQIKETTVEGKQLWLWLLVRCNSMDELMLFATGKNISRQTMDRLKEVYETGPGKDCNVKSLYCKSVNKCNDTTVTNTAFLVGSEALDEVVGGIKVQLAPKTNFWSNAAGAENVAKTVVDLLKPTSGTTVLEIGCGIGLIGLIMASECQRVIGVDSQSEIEEAEMTCELNNIKNASFIMGSPSEVTTKIINAIKNCKTYAVINTNTNIGRALDVMTCLRKISTLWRLVMITTLTRQSVRAILELTRPFDRNIGHPFIPVRACVVDTLPVGPNLEVVILMERLVVNKLTQTLIQKIMEPSPEVEGTGTVEEGMNGQTPNSSFNKNSANKTLTPYGKKNNKLSNRAGAIRKGKFNVMAKKSPLGKITDNSMAKGFNKFKGKRMHSPERAGGPPKKLAKKTDKIKHWRPGAPAEKRKEWAEQNSQFRNNSFYGKKNAAISKEQADLRERLSNNRVDPDIVQKVKEHQVLLEIAKEKLSGRTPTIDMSTAKQLQNMLNMVLEQTTKLQNQLPRSVWDRIAPVDSAGGSAQNAQGELILKDRYVQEMTNRDIIITTPNKSFFDGTEERPEESPKQLYERYDDNVASASNITPVNCPSIDKLNAERYHELELRQSQNQGNNWNNEKMFKDNWNDMSGVRKPASPARGPMSPMRNHQNPPREFCPKRPLLSPPRHMTSPPRRHLSPAHDPSLRFSPHVSLMKQQMSPQARVMSLPRQAEFQSRRQMMPQEHEARMTRSSSINRGSPQNFVGNRLVSPPRRQQSPLRRQLSPQGRFSDGWNISSRRSGEHTTWARSADRIPEKAWKEERPLNAKGNWEQQLSGNNSRYREPARQDSLDTKGSAREGIWISGRETWNKQQLGREQFSKGNAKDTWQNPQNSRWSNASSLAPNNDNNWSVKGKSSFEARDEPWTEKSKWEATQTKDVWNKVEKEDWNDLPEDARDPWGDDGNLGLKDRLPKFDSPSSSSFWIRETDMGDAWKNKRQSLGPKSQWHTADNQNAGEKRWMIQNDSVNKLQPTSSWQSGSTFGSWQQQSFNFPTQRQFNSNQFKDQR